MAEQLKKALAPAVLGLTSAISRRMRDNARVKDGLWYFSQRYAAYFGIERSVPISNGMRMRVSSAPRVEQELFLFGEWEPLFTRYLNDFDKNDGIFLDIGANIGYFSLLASHKFQDVHAIEASPSTFARLRESVAANNLTNVHIHNVAVGEVEGHVDFFQDPDHSGAASVIAGSNRVFEARVPIAPLEKILGDIDWHRVRFAKIDVEGFEAPVLKSLFERRDDLHEDVEIFCEFDPKREDVWPAIQGFLDNNFSAVILQGTYDRGDYLDRNKRSEFNPITTMPHEFCDILLRRA